MLGVALLQDLDMFNQLVHDSLDQLLIENGYRITEESEGYVQYSSGRVTLIFTYDEREKSNHFYIAENEDDEFPIGDKLIKSIFHSSLRIENLPSDVFVDNINRLLSETEGKTIMIGTDAYEKIKDYVESESRSYTNDLLRRQFIQKADLAWKNKDYREFLNNIDRISKEELPPSYLLKYKIAHKNVIH